MVKADTPDNFGNADATVDQTLRTEIDNVLKISFSGTVFWLVEMGSFQMLFKFNTFDISMDHFHLPFSICAQSLPLI